MKILSYLFILSLCCCTKAVLDNSATTPVQNVTDTVITYSGHIKIIMTKHCVSCHNGAAARAGLSLTTYQEVKNGSAKSNSRMNNASDPMPPSGLISKAEREQFAEWISGGFKE